MLFLSENLLHFENFWSVFYSSFRIDVLSLFISTVKVRVVFSSEIPVPRPTSVQSKIRKHQRYNGISVKP